MKLSVILISYNEKEFLSQAIESCLSQNFCDFEIIIGDDGSCDGSLALIEGYAKKYPEKIKFFVMERNNPKDVIPSLRVSAVIKRAAAMASGEYVNLLSGDDYFCDDHKFKRQISFLESKGKKYFAVASSFFRGFSDGTLKKEGVIGSGGGGSMVYEI